MWTFNNKKYIFTFTGLVTSVDVWEMMMETKGLETLVKLMRTARNAVFCSIWAFVPWVRLLLLRIR